jgi:hypothetical protein
MQEGTIEYRLILYSAYSDFLLSEFLENTFFEGAGVQVHRANSIPSKPRGGESQLSS